MVKGLSDEPYPSTMARKISIGDFVSNRIPSAEEASSSSQPEESIS